MIMTINSPSRPINFKSFFFALLLTILFLSPHAAMAANNNFSCGPYKPARILIVPRFDTPGIDNSKSLSEVAQLSGTIAYAAGSRHETPVGLTVSRLGVQTSYLISTEGPALSAARCGQISEIRLAFGFENTTIYIAREVPSGTCGYMEVLAHENKHVATNKGILNDYQARVSQYLADAARQAGVIYGSSAAEVEQILRSRMTTPLKLLSDSITRDQNYRQSLIDTKEEYSRLSRSCNNQISRAVSGSLKNLASH